MNKRFLLIMLAFFLICCGRKSPLSPPAHRLPLRVILPKAEKREGVWIIEGEIVGKIKEYKISDVIGCIVQYSRFSLKNPPCESCPIYLGEEKRIKADVIKGEKFFLKMPWLKKEGIYYMRIRLIGKDNSVGPPSQLIKILIKEEKRL